MTVVNEANTEIIVEDHLKQYADAVALGMYEHEWIYERQASQNNRINKALAGASKKDGTGKGRPDFIIQSRTNPDFIIVIECKSKVAQHESATYDQYADYAVDGALLYSSFLSRSFDVLTLAISGETLDELKVSHFLQLKGKQSALPMFGDSLLSLDDYLEGYIKSPEKFRQDYQSLLAFSQELNKKLHQLKIAEDERALLIACILIALENKSFLGTYKEYSEAKQLADFLIFTTHNMFEVGNIGEEKLHVLDARFHLIVGNSALIRKGSTDLRDIITEIDENINSFIKTHEYFDALGQIYIEFLRYANSDKGLGIVLTPPHITEFMAELAEVNKDSVVYDNCTGTGGFLVSAMSIMVRDAQGDSQKVQNIKQKQLIGVEFSDKIFPLVCSNMFIHQDGKTNIFHGSCFDAEIQAQIKILNPTVGLLNPPYKNDKKTDTDEYDFILANLACLQQGARCVAIVPMQEALATSGKILECKKKVLREHTLEAVFSMPDELFFNSKVSVVSCVMVFTAKRPHPTDKEVYFGYYKEDGFVKRKRRGRIDLFGTFEDEIKQKWINAYRNHKFVPGLSVLKVVTAKDEWCAEAYMETDYSDLSVEDFMRTVKQFAVFQASGLDEAHGSDD
jgi:type I restriction-modification system DNA methylase subunit